ncbi:MAG: hypothetical protein IMY87_03170 [Chloroflexi bacterium]|jgi:hypothetical protein|nr:hypothetical protein [Chloroflexota bacterium]
MENKSSNKLEKTMRELWLKVRRPNRTGTREEPVVDTSPGCAFGAVVEERLKNMEGNIQELKGRINGLIFLLVGVVLVEAIMRFVA